MAENLRNGDRVRVSGLVGGDEIGHVMTSDTFSYINRATGRSNRVTQWQVLLESGTLVMVERSRIKKARIRKK